MPTGETTITSAPAGQGGDHPGEGGVDACVDVVEGAAEHALGVASSRSSASSCDRSQNWCPATCAAQNVSHARSKGCSARSSAAASATRAGAPSSRRRRPSISSHRVAAEHLVDGLGPAEEALEAAVGVAGRRPPLQHHPVVQLPAAHQRAGRRLGGRAALVGVDGQRARPVGARAAPTPGPGPASRPCSGPADRRRTTGTGRRARAPPARPRCRACAGRPAANRVAGASRSCQTPRSRSVVSVGSRPSASSLVDQRRRWPRRTGGSPASVHSRGVMGVRRPPAAALARAASTTTMTACPSAAVPSVGVGFPPAARANASIWPARVVTSVVGPVLPSRPRTAAARPPRRWRATRPPRASRSSTSSAWGRSVGGAQRRPAPAQRQVEHGPVGRARRRTPRRSPRSR